MTTSDWIQIISIIATFLISTVSIIIALKSLKLTKNSIESANRPYVACFLDMVSVGHYQKYLVIKNFGSTPAIIKKISFIGEITLKNRIDLDSLHETTIAPNQKFAIVYDKKASNKSIVTVKINYQDLHGNLYEELFQINPNFTKNLVSATSKQEDNTDKYYILKNIFHEITKTNL
ncbi:hypothetical protein [Listeria seeligeri]|uniref:hypothetical protein n=1 Tax=Listeria seeligeri TaxID=1640 RepID=UPI0010B66C5C|nr:hypothetical protein [Listeria seeligeri]